MSGTARKRAERIAAAVEAWSEADAIRMARDLLAALDREAQLRKALKEAEDALWYIDGFDMPSYDGHMRPEEVARRYFSPRKTPLDVAAVAPPETPG